MVTAQRLLIVQSDGTEIKAEDAAGVYKVGDVVFGGIVTKCAPSPNFSNDTAVLVVRDDNWLPIW